MRHVKDDTSTGKYIALIRLEDSLWILAKHMRTLEDDMRLSRFGLRLSTKRR